jgi:hypothetical protein
MFKMQPQYGISPGMIYRSWKKPCKGDTGNPANLSHPDAYKVQRTTPLLLGNAAKAAL